jgi:hypothetical protein
MMPTVMIIGVSRPRLRVRQQRAQRRIDEAGVLGDADAEHRDQHDAERREADEHLHHLRHEAGDLLPGEQVLDHHRIEPVRGSIAEKHWREQRRDAQVMISASRNRIAGSGSLLPTRSIQSSILAIRGLGVEFCPAAFLPGHRLPPVREGGSIAASRGKVRRAAGTGANQMPCPAQDCLGPADPSASGAGPALLIGFARSIALILEDGQVLHTIVNGLAAPLQSMGAEFAAVGMLAIQAVIKLFIPSGSGQAYVTMPLMAPIGDLVGVSRQVAVLAFQFGDGFANIIVPTNPVLMGILGIAGVPYDRWFQPRPAPRPASAALRRRPQPALGLPCRRGGPQRLRQIQPVRRGAWRAGAGSGDIVDLSAKVRIASVAQETPSLPDPAIDFVISGDAASVERDPAEPRRWPPRTTRR